MKFKSIILATLFLLMPQLLQAGSDSRFFHSGDGIIHLKSNKSKATFNGRYRMLDGTYDDIALRQIHNVFSAKYGDPTSQISLRLIEFIDYLEDNFNRGATVTITSGYRSPRYNTGLRNKGRLAAKASLHQYGMAADIRIQNVRSEKIWNFVKQLNFGGAGYYHGANIHIDVGPARSWDEKTSGVGLGLADDNKLISIVANKDIYKAGETISMRFIRMTAFPIGVSPVFALETLKKDKWKKVKKFNPTRDDAKLISCRKFNDIPDMMNFTWNLSKKLKTGTYRIKVSFCENDYPQMPATITTPEIEVKK